MLSEQVLKQVIVFLDFNVLKQTNDYDFPRYKCLDTGGEKIEETAF